MSTDKQSHKLLFRIPPINVRFILILECTTLSQFKKYQSNLSKLVNLSNDLYEQDENV